MLGLSHEQQLSLTARVGRHRSLVRVTLAFLLAGAVLGQATECAFAVGTGVHFGVNLFVDNACTVQLIQNGTMGVNPAKTRMSSKIAGGTAGIADVYSFRNYNVTVDSMNYFSTSPTFGSDATSFTPTFSGTSINRGRTFAERPGKQAMQLRSGYSITRINVNLVIDKLTGTFPSGDYTAATIVRCE